MAGLDVAVLVGLGIVIVDLLVVALDRRAEVVELLEPLARFVIARRHFLGRYDEARPLIDDREADVAVVELHVRHALEALVADRVADGDDVAAGCELDAPAQQQILVEDARLTHLALDEDDVVVAAPFVADMHIAGRGMRVATVQSQCLAVVDAGSPGGCSGRR